jgi:hypothetical protein
MKPFEVLPILYMPKFVKRIKKVLCTSLFYVAKSSPNITVLKITGGIGLFGGFSPHLERPTGSLESTGTGIHHRTQATASNAKPTSYNHSNAALDT